MSDQKLVGWVNPPTCHERSENTTPCLQLYLEHGVMGVFGDRMVLEVDRDSTSDFQCPEPFTEGH